MSKKNCIIFSGAGISAQSGIKTFRDANGLWEGHKIEEVASFDGFLNKPKLVLDFYNMRRAQLAEVEPNEAHKWCVKLESIVNTRVITQNVDDLHERAGSAQVLHLHGQLVQSTCTQNCGIYTIGYKPIVMGDMCKNGHPIRPNIVWFGEEVPAMELAISKVRKADFLVVVGTSLEVYPAASLLHYCPVNCHVFVVDPYRHADMKQGNISVINKDAVEGMGQVFDIISRFAV